MKYKIVYWLNGNIKTAEADAKSAEEAEIWFLLSVPNDDIISIKEV